MHKTVAYFDTTTGALTVNSGYRGLETFSATLAPDSSREAVREHLKANGVRTTPRSEGWAYGFSFDVRS